ncbi:MAG TPA: TraR/DksA C4-type zinc finger protein [Galbitalea sp.]|nr:TraR/DksA C4-type zinc finger protein [Galbitalea sp.]
MTDIAERPTRISRLTSRQRTSLKALLESDRERTRILIDSVSIDLDAFVSARRDTATDDENDPEGPTLAFERSQSSAILDQSRRHVDEIDAALIRMDAGAYGLCTTCGQSIALGRLQVRPQAALCIVCAERLR